MKKTIAYFLACFLAMFGVFVLTLHSGWGQNTLRSWITSALNEEGIHADIESFQGFFIPNRLTLKHVAMDIPNVGKFSIEKVALRISLLYLLKQEIRLLHVKADEIHGDIKSFSQKEPLPTPSVVLRSSKQLPWSFSIDSLNISHVYINDIPSFSVIGSLKVKSYGRGLFFDLQARQDQNQLIAWYSSPRKGIAKWDVRLNITDSALLQPLYPTSLQGALQFHAKGADKIGKGMKGSFSGKVFPQNGPKPLQGPWKFKGLFQRDLTDNWSISHINLQGDKIQARGNFSLDPKGQLLESSGQIEVTKLPLAPVEGELLARWMVRKEGEKLIGKAIGQIPQLRYDTFQVENINLLIDTTDTLGSLHLQGSNWTLDSNLDWNERLQLTDISLEAPQIKGKGRWEFLENRTMQGAGELKIENLQILKSLAPSLNPYGQLTAKMTWNESQATLDMLAKDLYIKSVYFEQAAFYSDIHNPLNHPTAILSIDAEKGSFRDLQIDSIIAETTLSEGEPWPFTLFAEGVWNRDFESHSTGIWHLEQKELSAEIFDFYGLFYSHPFSLQQPVELLLTSSLTQIGKTQIQLGENAQIAYEWEEDSDADFTHLALHVQDFPLDFLSINPLEVSVAGNLDIDAKLTQTKDHLQGDLEASITEATIHRLGEADWITAEGKFNGRINQNELFVQANLSTRGAPLTTFELQLPIRVKKRPWQIQPLQDLPIKGQWHFQGQLEDCLDFFNLGPHWLQGTCKADLSWSNTLKKPLVKGLIQLTDGYYENYNTGTQLTNLQATLVADKGTLHLTSLTANDKDQQGALLADGLFDLRLDKKFPFHVHLATQEFAAVQLGFFLATINSALDIKGSMESATARGEVHIIQSDLLIPENISKAPPNLHVVYLNAQKPLPSHFRSGAKSYPLYLDISVDTPNPVEISGRGLQSQWQGNFALKGTRSTPELIGQLTLNNGEFSFSGRVFKLTKGAISFNEKTLVPHIDLSGNVQQQGMIITAHLQGPLNKPQLTFQSAPPLPLSSIIAYLLFGQEISEINGLQALQLATAVANIAGQSGDVLESTRRSLGIDRLRIIAEPDSEGNETLSIQVGKYVAPGVIVFITQTTDETAPNISIEADIGAGFFFHAETDQVHEQGKFGIKWNRNY